MGATIQNVLASFIIGHFFSAFAYEHVWWPYLTADASILKSKVTAADRSYAVNFYKGQINNPRFNQYALWAAFGLLVLSLGGAAVRDSRRRLYHATGFVLSALSGLVFQFKVLALKSSLFKLKHQREAETLRDIALWSAVSALAIFATLLATLSAAEAEEAEEIVIVEKRKPADKSNKA
ncbi:uncharacterized protein BJ171DRAFT_514630, partial [Polychytrium aggregatum]|uniref:uncharacterized protein n=1 Tax=Polychytrium aggregatum TaxID=110093 RepID=UPI0022FDD022